MDIEAFPNFYYTYNQLIMEAQPTAVKLSVSNVEIYLHLSPLSIILPYNYRKRKGVECKSKMSLNSPTSLDLSRNSICAGNKGDVSKITTDH